MEEIYLVDDTVDEGQQSEMEDFNVLDYLFALI